MNRFIDFEGHQIDILNQDGTPWNGQQDPWFISRQVAESIGAKNLRQYANDILNKNPNKFEGFRFVSNLLTQAGKRKNTIKGNPSPHHRDKRIP